MSACGTNELLKIKISIWIKPYPNGSRRRISFVWNTRPNLWGKVR
jgi:hypothetical protein